MNVLIVGGYNVFVSQLIEKFNKEGWEVYQLTGSRHAQRRHPYVFEQYDFPYGSESIKEIVDSAAPDLVVFSGAYDSGMTVKNTRREYMDYMSGLVNVLMASKMLDVPKFVYISSHEVYEESYNNLITEEEPPTPVTTRGMLITQGEQLVVRYGETTDMDTIVLRLDHMYWLPRNRKEIGEVHGELCFSALKNQSVSASAKKIFSSVYITDAIFAIYEIIKKENHNYRIYNITTSEEENELNIANIIKEFSVRNIKIKDNTIGLTQRNIMSNQRLREEFELETRFSYQERVRHIMEYMDKNRSDFLKRDERNGNWIQRMFRRFEKLFFTLIPFVENGFVFLLVFLLNNRTADSEYFRRLDVFLLYVVLFAVFFGKRQAILSAFLSAIGFIFRQSYYRTGVEVLVDYNIYVWMAQLFIVGMAVGHLRDSLTIVREDKDEEIKFLSGQLDDIYDINGSNLKVKNILEDHIISYEDSLGVLENLTENLEHLHAGEAVFQAADILSTVLETKDVAIYKISNADYCRLLVATTDEAKALGKSLKYTECKELKDSMDRNEVFVNRNLQAQWPVLAYALRRGETPEYILMVWGLPFEKMSLHQLNLLKVLGNMIQNAIVRSDTFLEAVSEKRYLSGTDILNKEAFLESLEMSREISEKEYGVSTLLCVQSAGPVDKLLEASDQLNHYDNILEKGLRETDVVGIGEDGYLYILLSNSNEKEAQIVIERFARQGIVCSLEESI